LRLFGKPGLRESGPPPSVCGKKKARIFRSFHCKAIGGFSAHAFADAEENLGTRAGYSFHELTRESDSLRRALKWLLFGTFFLAPPPPRCHKVGKRRGADFLCRPIVGFYPGGAFQK